MPPRRALWTQKMYDLAAEGCWDKEYVLWEMLVLVPVGMGARRTQASRDNQAARKGHTVRPQGEHHSHAARLSRPGQRQIASEALSQARRYGLVVIDTDGIVRLPDPK